MFKHRMTSVRPSSFLNSRMGCIRLILGQTKSNETTRTALLAQSERIDLLIAATRKEAAHLF
jgi:hypothetical protein